MQGGGKEAETKKCKVSTTAMVTEITCIKRGGEMVGMRFFIVENVYFYAEFL